VSSIDPRQFRAGVEWIESAHVLAPARGSLVHAEWSPRRHPPRFLYSTTSHEIHAAWCGTRLRLTLTEMFDPAAEEICPACMEAFGRGYPEALAPSIPCE
jgi:hypothetical protein